MPDPRFTELRELLPRGMLSDWVRLGARALRLFKDENHPQSHTAVLDRLLQRARYSATLRDRRQIHVPRPSIPSHLPIAARWNEIVSAIRDHRVLIVAGETGSGKTTQLPKMCLEAGFGIAAKIGCTQPRRVAALSISRRIAEELDVAWGREVGCKIRFDDRSDEHTYIKLMTDGILLAETQHDPDLVEYEALILDEAHERSLNIDFLLGYLKGLLQRRTDLRLIITSATIDTQAFASHFGNAPVIEVSGRAFPVEIRYHPETAESEEAGDYSYVDAAVAAVEDVLTQPQSGDVLVFMPGERDIRECSGQLEGLCRDSVDVIPMFGRLGSGEQQRAFGVSAKRKVVIATNIAETSLTIPGIRYVIDTGLARISRYNPRARTRRLPVEPVSQSSANQRAGRAGRVQGGICVRLYSEADFLQRPAFTQPEIQRSNLAEVILRLEAFRLGHIENFPFLQPPSPAAIANGYSLLQELGALDAHRALTPLGHDLARLPIDPALGRMLLQSKTEGAMREVLVIASGLSIQDPRERPFEQKEAAAAAHRRFLDPRSDFLILWKIWGEVHDRWEALKTQRARRGFCRERFLSYTRMREWQDLHAQLSDVLEDLGMLALNPSPASYDAIHRSILVGLIGHAARREEYNTYKITGNRTAVLFPGSGLYRRDRADNRASRRVARDPQPSLAVTSTPASLGIALSKGAPSAPTGQPEWIVAGELVETSQLFARTAAEISPAWIHQLAPHCCKTKHINPRWDPRAGRVLADEVILFQGLEIVRRKVGFAQVSPTEATEIFIRSALIDENLALPQSRAKAELAVRAHGPPGQRLELDDAEDAARELPPQYPFVAHNRAVRQRIESFQTRVRRYGLPDPAEALMAFYASKLANVSSTHDLNAAIRAQGGQQFLCISELEMTNGTALDFDSAAYPDSVAVGGQPVQLAYVYAPGESHDGVTVRLPAGLARVASDAVVEWAVPGMRTEKIEELLRALPKAVRKALLPLPPKISEIVRDFQPAGSSFLASLAQFLCQRYGVEVRSSMWLDNAIPIHLRPRIEILGPDQKVIRSGRDLSQLQRELVQSGTAPVSDDVSLSWNRSAEAWERHAVTDWNFGDLPERITVEEKGSLGLAIYAWPGLALEDGLVHVRLFGSVGLARASSLSGVHKLLEVALARDLVWIEKDLRSLDRFDNLCSAFASLDQLREMAMVQVKQLLLPGELPAALTRAYFDTALAAARVKIPGLALSLIHCIANILAARESARKRIEGASRGTRQPPAATSRTLFSLDQIGTLNLAPAASSMRQGPPPSQLTDPFSIELAALLPARFLQQTPFDQLQHLPRYLKALEVRVERARLNPLKDKEKADRLAPYLKALARIRASAESAGEMRVEIEKFRWMIEEFKVSLFAQELGTAVPISPKRLDEQIQRITGA